MATNEEKLGSFISRLDENKKKYMASGVRSLRALDYDKRIKIYDAIIDGITGAGYAKPAELIGDVTGLSEDDSNEIAFAVAYYVAIVSEIDCTPDQIFDNVHDALFSDDVSNVSIEKEIIDHAVKNRDRSKELLEQARISSKVLPSIISVDYSTEVRFDVIDGVVARKVPLVVIGIRTDIEETSFFAQLSKKEIIHLIKTLEQAASELSIVEGSI